eukprot:m.149520 g.149520  ORF g.149520 m.149520 type:complete len:306 (-) comp30662_c0_seq3:272-1189(-)
MGTTATREERPDVIVDDDEDVVAASLDPKDDMIEHQAPLGSPRRTMTTPISIPTREKETRPLLDAWVGSNPHTEPQSATVRSTATISTLREVPARPRTLKVLFKWTGDATSVAVAGSFNNWQNPVPLQKLSHNEFRTELELDMNEHEELETPNIIYKYIVDGKWKHDPLAPVVASGLGSLNNILKLDDKYSDDPTIGIDNFGEADSAFGRNTPPGDYAQKVPTFEERDAPPLLPPHLKEATLNCEPGISDDPSDLPVPNHVVLDHLYAQSVKDNVLVLGATHRYKRKYVTTVLYKPLSTVVAGTS